MFGKSRNVFRHELSDTLAVVLSNAPFCLCVLCASVVIIRLVVVPLRCGSLADVGEIVVQRIDRPPDLAVFELGPVR